MTITIGAGAMHTLHWLADHPNMQPTAAIRAGIGHANTAPLRRHLHRLEELQLVWTDELQGDDGRWRLAAMASPNGKAMSALDLRTLTPTLSRTVTAIDVGHTTRDDMADALCRRPHDIKRDLEVVRDAGLAWKAGITWSLTARGQTLARLLAEMPDSAHTPQAPPKVMLPGHWAAVLVAFTDGEALTDLEMWRATSAPTDDTKQRRRTIGFLADAELIERAPPGLGVPTERTRWCRTVRGRRLVEAIPTDPIEAPRVSLRQVEACVAALGGADTRVAISEATGWASGTSWRVLRTCTRDSLLRKRPGHRFVLTDWGRAVARVLGPIVQRYRGAA